MHCFLTSPLPYNFCSQKPTKVIINLYACKLAFYTPVFQHQKPLPVVPFQEFSDRGWLNRHELLTSG